MCRRRFISECAELELGGEPSEGGLISDGLSRSDHLSVSVLRLVDCLTERENIFCPMTTLHAIAQGHFLFVDIRDPEIILGIVYLEGNLRDHVFSHGQRCLGLTDRGAVFTPLWGEDSTFSQTHSVHELGCPPPF